VQIPVGGVSIHVQVLGQRASRPDVVMAHGLLLGSLASWYFTVAPGLAEDRRVVLFDLRGHGMSERAPAGYDVATMAGDLAGVVAACAEPPVDLVGHSYGALAALRFAIDHPERVRRLVLVEAPLPPSSFHELDAFVARPPEEMIEALPEDVRGFVTKGGRRAKRFLEGIGFLIGKSSLVADLRAERDLPDATLAEVRAPVLAVYGDRSSCRPVGDRLARVIPDAELRVLPGGHYLHLDAGPALGRAIREFLEAPRG
jgi:pimeloyl-ACP methyl ester carboxylesterase